MVDGGLCCPTLMFNASYPVTVHDTTRSSNNKSHAASIRLAVPVSCSILCCMETPHDIRWSWRAVHMHTEVCVGTDMNSYMHLLSWAACRLPAACIYTLKIKCVWYWKFIPSHCSPLCDSAETASLWYPFTATPAKHSLPGKQCLACVCVCCTVQVSQWVQPYSIFFVLVEVIVHMRMCVCVCCVCARVACAGVSAAGVCE